MWPWVTKIFGGIFGKSFIVAAIVGGMALTGWLVKGWINNHLDDYYTTKYQAANYKAQNEFLEAQKEKSERVEKETDEKVRTVTKTVIEYREKPKTDEAKDWADNPYPDADRMRSLYRDLSEIQGSTGTETSDGDQ